VISVVDDRLSVNFERFGLEEYDVFLKTKTLPETAVEYDDVKETYRVTAPARFAGHFGLQAPAPRKPWLPLPQSMHDYQADLLRVALEAKRFAHWWDCGLGKCFEGLEWCRQVAHVTGGRVLVLTLKNLISDVLEQAEKFYGDGGTRGRGDAGKLRLLVLRTRADLISFCKGPRDGAIGITNFEKFVDQSELKNSGMIRELSLLAGLWCDESSILKAGGGVIKWNLMKSARGIEYKLSTTATPAPNDLMEYASQAGFLEKIKTEQDVLWTYFQRDKAGKWTVKPWAIEAFYRFMASWSVYLRNPARYGYADNLKSIPAPVFHTHQVPVTVDQLRRAEQIEGETRGRGDAGTLASERKALGIVGRGKLAQLARGFIYETSPSVPPLRGEGRTARRVLSRKPGVVARLAERERAAGRQVLLWTEFDEESAILSELLPDFEVLTGSIAEKERKPIIDRFKRGDCGGLITRAELLGFGQNFQNCTAQIVSGLTDSYEELYQMIRRSYRYGQSAVVHIHVPYVPELEGAIYDNVMRKAANFEADTEQQEKYYVAAMKELRAA